jgi:hypothetical protein
MSGLTWKINRLKAMGWKEILHRSNRAVLIQCEKKRFELGWKPLPTVEVKKKMSLFPRNNQIVEKWQELFTLDPLGLSELLDGKVDFFGHEPISIGKPVQWHCDPVTKIQSSAVKFGKTLDYRNDALVGNVKFIWELGRHQHLVPLAVAYAVTGEHKYKDEVVRQIDGWIEHNPVSLGIHWCTSLEVALRLISWAIVHSLFSLRDNDGLIGAVEDSHLLGNSIYQHTWFVVNFLSRYSSANNHLIGELTGLLTACQVFDLGADGEKWGKLAQRELEFEAKKQIFPDGVNKEQATYYHLWVLEYLLFASLVGNRTGEPFSVDFENIILGMAGFLEAIRPPGGSPPQIGDADDGFVMRFEARWPGNPFEDVLSGVKLTKYGKQPEHLTEKAFWYSMMDGIKGRNFDTTEKDSSILVYPKSFVDGGYAVLGDDVVHLIFDAGPLGYPSIAAHGHADALSFCLAVDGEWWFIDPGTYAYHSSPVWRNYFRSTAAHNTLEINGRDQSLIGGPFLWLTHAPVSFKGCGDNDGTQWVVGCHEGYNCAVHTRKISYVSGQKEIIIHDTVAGKGRQNLALNFHFSPDISIECVSAGVWLTKNKDSKRILSISVQKRWDWTVCHGATEPISGWYSSKLEDKQPTNTLHGCWTGLLPVNVETVIKVIC